MIWSDPAEADLAETVGYVARNSVSAAVALIEAAELASASLAYPAERGRRVSDLRDPDLREIFVGRYRLKYRVRGDTVSIVAFVHGARDWRP